MYIEPIREEQRLSREEAVRILKGIGFTDGEVFDFLAAKDPADRTAISKIVEQRKKGAEK